MIAHIIADNNQSGGNTKYGSTNNYLKPRKVLSFKNHLLIWKAVGLDLVKRLILL